MKYLSARYLFIVLIFTSSLLYSDGILEADTVNIRKVFFSKMEADWYKYAGKRLYFEKEKTALYIDNDASGDWELRFYNSQKNFDDIYAFGRILYNFNEFKELQRVRVYIHRNNNSYILFDKEKKGKCDIYLFGRLYKMAIPYYFEFESLMYISLSAVLDVIKFKDYYREVVISEDDGSLKEKFIRNIIYPSMNQSFVDDGARDPLGNYIYINTGKPQLNNMGLNCSGFTKEIIDTYIRLKDNEFKFTDPEVLKRRRLDERKSEYYSYYENELDPYFGRDWVKNIADIFNKASGYDYIAAAELRDDPVAPYFDGSGYLIEDLKGVLFRDQKVDQSFFYMAVFNRLRKKAPGIPEFYHISVLVPYFSNNHFYIRVFESNEETSFNQLLSLRRSEKAFIMKVPIFYSHLFTEVVPYIEKMKFEKMVLDRLPSKGDRNFLLSIYRLDSVSGIYYITRKLESSIKDRVIELFEKTGYFKKESIKSDFDD